MLARFARRVPLTTQVREVTSEFLPPGVNFQWQAKAMEALQEAAEAYLTNLFMDAYVGAVDWFLSPPLTAARCRNVGRIHAKRATVFPRDIQLTRYMRGVLMG